MGKLSKLRVPEKKTFFPYPIINNIYGMKKPYSIDQWHTLQEEEFGWNLN